MIQDHIQPPANTDVRAWLQQRREELSNGRKRTQFHRTQVDQVGNVGKVRRHEITTNN